MSESAACPRGLVKAAGELMVRAALQLPVQDLQINKERSTSAQVEMARGAAVVVDPRANGNAYVAWNGISMVSQSFAGDCRVLSATEPRCWHRATVCSRSRRQDAVSEVTAACGMQR